MMQQIKVLNSRLSRTTSIKMRSKSQEQAQLIKIETDLERALSTKSLSFWMYQDNPSFRDFGYIPS